MQEFEKRCKASEHSKQNVLFRNSCIISVIICFVTHAYAYFNATFFHDRSGVIYPETGFASACMRARWMQPFVNVFTAFDYLPWLCGVLAIVFLTVSVYIIVDILEIEYMINICLIAGICIANNSVVNAHMYWAPEILVALPFALISAWIWKKERKHIIIRIAAEAFFVGLSLASYGAYTSVGPCIVIVLLFFELLDNQKWLKALRRGIEYIVAFVIGMIFYYIVLRLCLHFQNLTLTSYMGRDRLVSDFPDLAEILGLMKRAWYSTLLYLRGEKEIRLILALSGCILVTQIIRQMGKECYLVNFLMMLALMMIFPLSVGLIYVMAFGSVHWLMKFTYVMPYIAIITLLDREQKMYHEKMKGNVKIFWGIVAVVLAIVSERCLNSINGRMRFVCLGIVVCIGFYSAYLYLLNHLRTGGDTDDETCNLFRTVSEKSTLIAWCAIMTILICIKMYTDILNANIAYMKCDEINSATRSLTIRLLGRVEDCEGFEGNEEIVFVGDVSHNNYISATDPTTNSKWKYLSDDIFVSEFKNGITYSSTLCALMKTDAGCTLPCKFASVSDFSLKEQASIDNMPNYPADGSIRKIGENIVVKISEE